MLLASCSLFVACRDNVVLGSWPSAVVTGDASLATMDEPTPEAGVPISRDAGAEPPAAEDAGDMLPSPDSGLAAVMPSCLAAGVAGEVNVPGQELEVTETATDWTWPAPVAAMQWDVMVERELVRPTDSPATSGYYYAYQFSFLEGVAGFFGIQDQGVYQTDPPSSPVEITKMAVFWLSGPPLEAELGDIEYPDARVAPTTVSGVSYLTIHARFDWQTCRVYRFRIGPDEEAEDGSIWYSASIEDQDLGVKTVLGRMRLPADIGPLSPFSVSRSIPIDYSGLDSCSEAEPAAVVFGIPKAEQPSLSPARGANRFDEPLGCGGSRFTHFPGAVRHELGSDL